MKYICQPVMILILLLSFATAQAQQDHSRYLNKRWKDVATKMPADWYGSEEAKTVAEHVLLAQKEIGGWPKNIPFHHMFSEEEQSEFKHSKSKIGATFDNGATITELKFLANIYSHFKDARYKQAFDKGLEYIFISQYDNGGWPQFYPYKGGYANQITYNDNAMVNIMEFLDEIASGNEAYASLQISNADKAKARKAIEKGVECFLNTQIIVADKPTVWCAQHDEKTLAPAKARSYELESFSGAESAGIVLFLMSIDHPSKKIIAAVNGAVAWFENHKIEGIKLDTEIDQDGNKNRIVVEDKNAPPIWARFYDLKTSEPYFCDRDGIKKKTLAEIGYERRNGYSWYIYSPAKVLKKYPKWKERWVEE